ncbi:MAG: STAS domain-containing protein [Bryobacteraceae bacterium]
MLTSMVLEIKESRMEPDITVVQLSGRLALGRAGQGLEGLVAGYVADGRLRVMLDLTRVDYIDSAGIGVLAMAAGQLKQAGGRLALVAGEGRVRALLRLTGLDEIMPLSETVEQAADRLRAGGAQPSAAAQP